MINFFKISDPYTRLIVKISFLITLLLISIIIYQSRLTGSFIPTDTLPLLSVILLPMIWITLSLPPKPSDLKISECGKSLHIKKRGREYRIYLDDITHINCTTLTGFSPSIEIKTGKERVSISLCSESKRVIPKFLREHEISSKIDLWISYQNKLDRERERFSTILRKALIPFTLFTVTVVARLWQFPFLLSIYILLLSFIIFAILPQLHISISDLIFGNGRKRVIPAEFTIYLAINSFLTAGIILRDSVGFL